MSIGESRKAQQYTPHRSLLLKAGIAYLQSGLSIIPIGENNKPIVTWKKYQSQAMVPKQLEHFLTQPQVTGLAAVCGAVSGNLLILDFDIPRFYDVWRQAVGSLADELPLQKTGNGYQLALRCDEPGRNTPLAWAPNEQTLEGREIAIETRGEGGYALLPPSLHPNGNHYTALNSDFASIPYVDMPTVKKLLDAARTLDEAPLTLQKMAQLSIRSEKWESKLNGETSVIAAFNDAFSIREMLECYHYELAGSNRYRRPGGESASVAILDGKYSYHWSTNDSLCDGHRHDAFSVYCTYEHNNDVKLAVKDAAELFGIPKPLKESKADCELEEELPDVLLQSNALKRFPVEVLPTPLQQLVVEGAKTICCPPDFLAVPLLVLAGTAIGTSRVIQIKPDWCEGPRIYAGIVADPGSKKSPALNLVLSLFWKQQQKKEREHQQALELYQKQQSGKEPSMEQVITTDSTLEALAEVIAQNPRGLVFYRDELTGWVRSMNQYKGGHGDDKQAWLSFWNGAHVVVNRKNRKAPLMVNNPFVSVVGAIPPEMLSELTDMHSREDGFIHRILFAYPERLIPQWTDESLSPDTMTSVETVFDRLWELEPIKDETGRLIPKAVCFTECGKRCWVDWINGHFAELMIPEFLDSLLGPWSKMEGYCARLALILHECRLASNEVQNGGVDEVCVTGAIALIEYFKAQVRRVYAQLRVTPEDKKVSTALRWIRRNGGQTTRREIMRNGVADVKTIGDTVQLFELLQQRGYGLIEEKTPHGGGRKSITFTLNAKSTNDKSMGV